MSCQVIEVKVQGVQTNYRYIRGRLTWHERSYIPALSLRMVPCAEPQVVLCPALRRRILLSDA